MATAADVFGTLTGRDWKNIFFDQYIQWRDRSEVKELLDEHVERYQKFGIPVPQNLIDQIRGERALAKLKR